MAQKKLNGRVLTSLVATSGLLLMILTGLVLYLQPHGRVAYWTDWRFWGLSKTQWGNIHVIGAFLWTVGLGFHVYYNWNPIMRYLGMAGSSAKKYGKELGIALLLTVWVVLSAPLDLPPLSWIMEFGESYKDSWVQKPSDEPPFGHAELSSLKGICRKMGIPYDQAIRTLKAAGIDTLGPKAILADIAIANNTSPAGVYAHIHALEAKPPKPSDGAKYTDEMVEEQFSGTGLGKKTLAQVAETLGLTVEAMQADLKAAGVEMAPDDKFKDAAANAGKNPMDLLKIVLVK